MRTSIRRAIPTRKRRLRERPPLLVMSHGGPTAATHPLINFRIQYYTTRGWAVADVNYGGSSGYGRAYRERLDGQWGVVDVHDCEDRRRTSRARPIASIANRVAIRGGSAGGYTTLAALTFGNTFRAGASHYGIGDLETLARDTHKFESRYLDRLIGPYPQARDLYIERSPIHHVDRLTCPVVFFQGLEDRVVPPNQAEAMVDALRRRQLPVAYVAFEGEQHGFRQAANIRRALEGEYLFFARIFGFEPADSLPPLEIEFLGSHLQKKVADEQRSRRRHCRRQVQRGRSFALVRRRGDEGAEEFVRARAPVRTRRSLDASRCRNFDPTWCFRCCTVRRAKTAPCRDISKFSAIRTSAAACTRARVRWTRVSQKRSSVASACRCARIAYFPAAPRLPMRAAKRSPRSAIVSSSNRCARVRPSALRR